MSEDLYAFLHPIKPEEMTEEVIVSERFKNEKGEVVPFKIRPLTKGKVEQLARQCRAKHKGKDFDLDIELGTAMIVEATVEPDFKSKEICDAYGTLDPLDVVSKMLLFGESNRLANAISRLSGVDKDIDIKN
nr:MAG TPA: tail assembly chaperone protein [Caudoviricetes sp.]